MGSATFYDTSQLRDPSEAYTKLVQDALFERGHEAYNCTISTTSGFRVVQKNPVTQARADRIAASRIEDLSKWEACEAVAVGKAKKVRTRKVRITVEPDEHGACELTADAVAQALQVTMDQLGSYKVVSTAPRYRVETRQAGPARKIWQVNNSKELFDTKAQAMAHAKALAQRDIEWNTRHSGFRVGSAPAYEVRQRVVRTPEAAIVPRLLKTVFEVEVEVAQGPLEFDHWLFYGWAAC